MSSGSFDARTEPVLSTFAANALAGKTCLVTGAASGMGRAIARRFAESGARVVMADIQVEALEEAADAIRGLRVEHDPQPVAGDLAAVDACAEVVARAVETGGRLNAVVNCAGMGGMVGTVESHPVEVWHRVLDTNLGSVFGVCRAAVPHLRAAGGGAIVNFASAAAYHGSAACPATSTPPARAA